MKKRTLIAAIIALSVTLTGLTAAPAMAARPPVVCDGTNVQFWGNGYREYWTVLRAWANTSGQHGWIYSYKRTVDGTVVETAVVRCTA